ncbi:pogo transposable element, putative [Talaromyces stipitatus ATCC 10500]|uniref:Pogo transposable element, putative n=1 Tax=Talaromyces stipitatus (strain ATCC 10500 / CBS 375.48 / QM 6759 / NRRL 1006) TaxID=441959 RepID=B8LUP5_TALSN|nr:pogo transposable element, putative [Talaromyces stipitatus ATCC 10500]EED23902.1 pogo transposable element, putative [Talaromyces stipitatus ATCC 10500]
MPPIRTRNTQNSSNQEGSILLAISDLENGRIRSIRQAVQIYDVPFTTLQRRLTGTQHRGERHANDHILTQYEEESLLKWILDLDKRGLPPRTSLVQDMADLLLSQHGNKHVSERWVYRFVDRHPEVNLRFSRRHNYEQAKCEDIQIIREHFNRVREVIQEYGILSEDIYNFDETGFAMGLCASAKVITGSDRYGRPNLLQPGNHEWVTAIEAVNSAGWALPSYVIFKGTTYHQQGWFETLPQDWRLDISNNGWTTDEIGIRWLQKHFIPHTTSRTKGRYRMLILDGHGSHLTPRFDQICTENNIIPPLDVSCFAVLKRQYGQLVEQRVRLGFNHIEKYDFLTAFPEARTMAYTAENIQNGFKATGLVPFDPDHIYQKLTAQLRTPTAPPSRPSNSQSSCLQTSQNPRQFKRQMTTTEKRINEHTTRSLEVIDRAIKQLSRAHEMSINELLIVRKEVLNLRAANEKEMQKRKRSRAQISHEGSLPVQEARELITNRDMASQPIPVAPVESEPQASQPRVRARPKCSGCGIIGHKINRCPNRTTS